MFCIVLTLLSPTRRPYRPASPEFHHRDGHLAYRHGATSSMQNRLLEPTTSHVDGILHQTSLVPGLWDTMVHLAKLRYGYQIPRRCLSSKYMAIDASRYTIMQRVVQDPSSSSSSTSPTIFSAIYKFIYQAPSPTEQTIPHMLTTEGLVQNSDFSLEALLSMEADAYPDVMSSFNGIDIPNYVSGHKRH
jgi:hypothetical protein